MALRLFSLKLISLILVSSRASRSCDSNFVCDCIELPQFAEWYNTTLCTSNSTSLASATNASSVIASTLGDVPPSIALFANVDPLAILVAVVTCLAMLALISLSVLYARYRKRNTTVGVLQKDIQRAQSAASEAQADNAELKESLAAAQQIVDRNLNEGGTALTAYKIRYSDLTMGLQLGEGSFGTVYHGTFRGSACAIKTVRATKVSDKMVKEFLGELTLMAPLRHPNLVGLVGGCWTDGPDKLCIVLEYCSKGTLGGMTKDPSNTWEGHYYEIALGVARCFVYLHHEQPGEPLIHRDLKPDNVLIAGDGTAKVADFGESTRFEDTRAAEEDDGALSMTRVSARALMYFASQKCCMLTPLPLVCK